MKHTIFLALFFLGLFSCGQEKSSDENADNAKQDTLPKKELKKVSAPLKVLKTKMGTEIPVYTFESFYPNVLERKEEGISYVVNFWATWCKPCVAELPHFFELEKQYSAKNVKFIYVSLDFMNNLETALIPFLEKQQIKNEIVVLDQKEADVWMEQIDKNWSGSIPATYIYNSKNRKFFERSFESAKDLESALNIVIK